MLDGEFEVGKWMENYWQGNFGTCCEGSGVTHAASTYFSFINTICGIMLCGLNLGSGWKVETF